MKKFFSIAVLAFSAMMATPALAADIKAEVAVGDPLDGRTDFTEFSVEYNDVSGPVAYGFEVESRQNDGAGAARSIVAGKIGTSFVVGPVTITPRAEVGHVFYTGDNFQIWGGEVLARANVIGPVSLEAGYRHRESFNRNLLNEERLVGTVEVAVTDKHNVGASYYRTRGTLDADAVGLFYKLTF